MNSEIVQIIYEIEKVIDKSVYSYGTFVENYIASKSLDGTTLIFFIHDQCIKDDIVNLRKKLKLEIDNQYSICYRRQMFSNAIIEIPYWKTSKKFNDITVNFWFHNKDYINEIETDSQNIIMHKWGFQIRDKYKHIDNIIEIFENLKSHKINLINKEDLFHFGEIMIPKSFEFEYQQIFKYLNNQLHYEKRGYECINGYSKSSEKCCVCFEDETRVLVSECNHSICNECVVGLFNSNMPNRFKCPLCRASILFKTNTQPTTDIKSDDED